MIRIQREKEAAQKAIQDKNDKALEVLKRLLGGQSNEINTLIEGYEKINKRWYSSIYKLIIVFFVVGLYRMYRILFCGSLCRKSIQIPQRIRPRSHHDTVSRCHIQGCLDHSSCYSSNYLCRFSHPGKKNFPSRPFDHFGNTQHIVSRLYRNINLSH